MTFANFRAALHVLSLAALGGCIAQSSRHVALKQEDEAAFSPPRNAAIVAGMADYPSQSRWNALQFADNDVEVGVSVLGRGYTFDKGRSWASHT